MLAENVSKFQSGNVEEAHKGMGRLLEKTSNEAFPLYQLTDASVLYCLGDLYNGCSLMSGAANNLEVELGIGTIATDLIGSEENVHYRGYVHERVLARYYLGLGYFQRGYYDSAKISFLQALEHDINKEQGKENTFASVHFMLGETFTRLKDFENAAVAFRKVTTLRPEMAIGWYKLATTVNKLRNTEEASNAYQKYQSLLGAEQSLPLDGSGSYIFLVLDNGWGPTLSPDFLTGQFASYSQVPYSERNVSVVVDNGVNKYSTEVAEDIYTQAKDEANLAGDVTRKVASKVTKAVIKNFIPFGGLLVGSEAADIRKWLLLPGDIRIALIPAERGIHDITLKFYNSEKKELPDYQQSWYYIPAAPEGEMPLIYVRSIFQRQNQTPKN
jgi:hypothetical protein